MMITMNNLHQLVSEARERRGYRTQGDLAAVIGRDVSYVSRLERGLLKEIPQPEMMDALARALGVTVAELLDAAGYDVLPRDEPSDVITIRRDDPRARVAEIMDAMPDDQVAAWIAALEVLTDAASISANSEVPSSKGTTMLHNRKTTA